MGKKNLIYQNVITSDNSLSYKYYLKDINKTSHFSKEEETELLKEYYKTGDINIRNKIIMSHQSFINGVAKMIHVKYPKCQLTDLINEGNIGMIESFDSFDIDKNIRFLSYAIWRIRSNMMKYVEENRNIKKSNIISYFSSIEKINKKFFEKYEHEPPSYIYKEYISLHPRMIAHILSLTDGSYSIRFNQSKTIVYDNVSNNHSLYSENPNVDEDYNDEANKIINKIQNDKLKVELFNIIDILPEEHKEVIMMWYGVGKNRPYTSEEIVEITGLSYKRIYGILQGFRQKMRLNDFRLARSLKKFL